MSKSPATLAKSGWKSAQLLITLRRERTVFSSVEAALEAIALQDVGQLCVKSQKNSRFVM